MSFNMHTAELLCLTTTFFLLLTICHPACGAAEETVEHISSSNAKHTHMSTRPEKKAEKKEIEGMPGNTVGQPRSSRFAS
jgi:hypothetical protein